MSCVPGDLWHSCPVRFAILITLIFSACTAAFAQTPQEEKARMDQILKPDQNRVNPMQARPFYGGKDFNQTRSALTKTFYFTEHVTPKTAAQSRDFAGTKNFLESGNTFKTKEAETHGWHWLSKVGNIFSSKKFDTKELHDAGKTFATRAQPGMREYLGPERDKMNRILPNTDTKMSMNEVRDLLNKRCV